MLRTLTVLTLALAAPLAAQVTSSSPARPVSPTLPTSVDPLSGYRSTLDVQAVLDRAQSNLSVANSIYSDLAYNYNFDAFDRYSVATGIGGSFSGPSYFAGGPRAPWVKSDPADSLYRSARDLLNRGDYRRSAALFKELPQKFPSSAYVNDAMYWQAFALYRIGGTPELQEALGVLETLKAKAPAEGSRNPARSSAGGSGAASGGASGGKGASSGVGSASASGGTTVAISGNIGDRLMVDRYNTVSYGGGLTWIQEGGRNDATALAARIANVLASRGMSNDPAVKRAQAAAGNNCDTEDQQVRSEALSALSQTDPEMARQSAIRALSRKDECSVPLRRTAVGMIARKNDEAAATLLVPVAKSDPSVDVRTTAIDYLARIPGDAALNTLQELSAVGDNDRVQRSAIRALASSTNPRAKVGLRALIEKNDAPEPLRLAALESYGRESSPDDIAWLRSTYAKVTSARVKSSIVSAVARIGGDANDTWLSTLLRNEDEPMEARMSALRQAGRSMDVTALAKLYDAATQRQIRSQVIDLLGERKEATAVDKLIDIAKTGTDPGMRRSAIAVLARSKDPRAQKLLLDLVDHE